MALKISSDNVLFLLFCILRILTREVDEDCEYGGMKFPAKSSVGVPISYMHYNEKLWPNPGTFDPERFHPDRKKDIHASAFLAFGCK